MSVPAGERLRRAWLALCGKDVPHWSAGQIATINYEMAEGIIHEIRDTLAMVGCCHGHDMEDTPPMFYREAILCAIKKAHDQGAAVRERDQEMGERVK